jgi:MFS family permease
VSDTVCRLCRVQLLQIAPPEVRGMLGSLNQLTICIGILGALVVNVVLPPDAWRVMFWLATIPAALLAFGEHAVERLTTVNGCLTEPMMLTLSIHHIKLCCCFHLSESASLLPGCSCRFAVCAGEPAVAVCQ